MSRSAISTDYMSRRLIGVLFGGFAWSREAAAHHAEDETILEAIGDHLVDNWRLTAVIAAVLIALAAWRWRVERRQTGD